MFTQRGCDPIHLVKPVAALAFVLQQEQSGPRHGDIGCMLACVGEHMGVLRWNSDIACLLQYV